MTLIFTPSGIAPYRTAKLPPEGHTPLRIEPNATGEGVGLVQYDFGERRSGSPVVTRTVLSTHRSEQAAERAAAEFADRPKAASRKRVKVAGAHRSKLHEALLGKQKATDTRGHGE